MSMQSNVELVKEAYAAFGVGDLQKLLGLMTPDIIWEFPTSKVIPWAGTFTGPSEVAQFFSALMEHSEPEAFEPLHFVASEIVCSFLGASGSGSRQLVLHGPVNGLMRSPCVTERLRAFASTPIRRQWSVRLEKGEGGR